MIHLFILFINFLLPLDHPVHVHTILRKERKYLTIVAMVLPSRKVMDTAQTIPRFLTHRSRTKQAHIFYWFYTFSRNLEPCCLRGCTASPSYELSARKNLLRLERYDLRTAGKAYLGNSDVTFPVEMELDDVRLFMNTIHGSSFPYNSMLFVCMVQNQLFTTFRCFRTYFHGTW